MQLSCIKYSVILLIFGISLQLNAQTNVSLKLSTVNLNFGLNENTALYNSSIDNEGLFTLEPGAIATLETFIIEDDLSFRFMQGMYLDRIGKTAGLSHIGLRFKLLHKYKHSIHIGVGSSLHYRKDWSQTPGYNAENIYTLMDNGWQVYLAKANGEVEYNYQLSNKSDLSFSFLQMHPMSVAFAIGYKYWFDREVKKWKSCNCSF